MVSDERSFGKSTSVLLSPRFKNLPGIKNSLELIKDIDEVYRVQAVHRTRILSASIRYVNSVSQSFANGADIVTMPPSVFDKMYNHVLTDKGLQIFDEDWKKTQELINK